MNETTMRVWFWVLLNVLIVVLIAFVLVGVLPAAAQYGSSLAPARQVTVTAQGTTTATPDVAEISFSVLSQGADPKSLSTDNNTKMNSVMEFLATQKIATSDIKTTSYDLQPNYQYDKIHNRNIINGYTLTQTVQVKIHDIANVATVLGGLTPLGVNQIGGVTFTFDSKDDIVAAARADAMSKAQAKAQSMASQANASLGEVVTVSESSVIPYPQPMYGMATGRGASDALSSVTPPIQPGTQEVTDNVTITYALR